jgi:hypothetical protein
MVERYRQPEPQGSTVHRTIPATGKHGWKTACGIKTDVVLEGPLGLYAKALDGWNVTVSEAGQPFDCPRCRRVLELRHSNRTFSIRRE